MEREPLLGRVAKVIGRAFSGLGSTQEKVFPDDPMQGLTKMERGMLHRASKIRVVYGNYREADELSAIVLKVSAERLKAQQSQETSGSEEDHQS